MRTIAATIAILASAFWLAAPSAAAGEGKPTAVQAEKSAPTRVIKPHSHVEEKTGMQPVQLAADRNAGGPNPWTDKSRHFHPRDK